MKRNKNNQLKIEWKKQKCKNKDGGITLIALVITIIVLLILAGISIMMLTGNNSILNQAINAKNTTIEGNENEAIKIAYIGVQAKYIGENVTSDRLEKELKNNGNNVTVTESGKKLKIFFKDTEHSYIIDKKLNIKQDNGDSSDTGDWKYAWVYTEEGWSEMIEEGEDAEGIIVVKFYELDNKITPNSILMGGPLAEGNEYHMTIEGTGDMPIVLTDDEMHAWEEYTYQSVINSEIPFTFFVTEVEIGSGITKIGEGSFGWLGGINSISIPESVTKIGDLAFSLCGGLESINLPSGLTSIGDSAFGQCEGLKSISIPSGVTSIEDGTFKWCKNLEKVIYNGIECTTLAELASAGITSIGSSAFTGTKISEN